MDDIPCIGNLCNIGQCCIIPNFENTGNSSTTGNSNSSNNNNNISGCSIFTSELDCIRNKCNWDLDTDSCSESSSNATNQKMKKTDPIPIKGNYFVVNNNISSYDGLCINTGNKDYWKQSPDDLPLIKDKDLYTMQGHNSPLKPVIADYSSLYGPSIDGDEDSSNKLFMFSNNLSSPACCPSTFSTSTGCLCTSKKQRDFIISRGNNVPANYNDLN